MIYLGYEDSFLFAIYHDNHKSYTLQNKHSEYIITLQSQYQRQVSVC